MNSSKHLDITEVIVTDMHFVPDPDDEDVKGRARQAVQASLATLTRNMVLNTADRETIEKKILKTYSQFWP